MIPAEVNPNLRPDIFGWGFFFPGKGDGEVTVRPGFRVAAELKITCCNAVRSTSQIKMKFQTLGGSG